MSAAEFTRQVEIPGASCIVVEATDSAEVWCSWRGVSPRAFLTVAKARELAAALTAAADATDDATREAESGVLL